VNLKQTHAFVEFARLALLVDLLDQVVEPIAIQPIMLSVSIAQLAKPETFLANDAKLLAGVTESLDMLRVPRSFTIALNPFANLAVIFLAKRILFTLQATVPIEPFMDASQRRLCP
jgi:hypothetical protein